MRDSKRVLRQGMSWLLTAAMTAGMLFATGITAGAETAAAGGKVSYATASDAERASAGRKEAAGTASDAEAEALDEDGYLKDGVVAGDAGETATASNAEREKYPVIWPYFLTGSPQRLEMQIYTENLIEGDQIFYTFITQEERQKMGNQSDASWELKEKIMTEKDRICKYDTEKMPVINIPQYLKSIGLEVTPGYFFMWPQNADDLKIKDIYAERNQYLEALEWECIMPRVIAKFENGGEAYSGSVEKGTKIFLETADSYYKNFEMAIQYTLNGTYPLTVKDSRTVPAEMFTKDEDLIVYSEENPIVINEDTILRAVAYPIKDRKAIDLPAGYDSWVVGTWNFTVSTGEKDQYEPNDTFKDAMPVSFPTELAPTIHDENDRDFFRFSNGSFASVRLMLTQPPYCAYGLRLLDENGETLKECVLKPETAGTMANNQAIIYSGADGKGLAKDQKFTAEVWSLNGTSDEKRAYTLRIIPTVYASGGELAKDPDFSEMDMVLSNNGKENGDQTDYTGYESRTILGASIDEQLNYLSQWYGPVNEILEPYPEKKENGETADSSFPYQDHSASVEYHLQNAVFGVSPEYGIQEYINTLKNLIYSYGSCTLSYEATDEGDNLEFEAEDGTVYRGCAFHYDPRERTDIGIKDSHTVQLVGWNDDLPKELFSHSGGTNCKQQDYGTPKENGGFLIKNSWGTKVGIDGFCWLSYEDTALLQNYRSANPAGAFLMEKAGQYDRLYLNDAAGMSKTKLAQASPMTQNYSTGSVEAGNVFTTDDHDQLLTAVSLILLEPGTNYDIWLTANGETKKILSGCERYGGYYTKQLADPVLLKANSDFVLTEVLYADGGMLVGTPFGGGAKSEGRSFMIDVLTGNIVDLSKDGDYPCLRALTVIPDYNGKPRRVCNTSFNKNYGTEASRAEGEVSSNYAAVIKENSIQDTLVSSAAGDSLTVSDLPASYDSRNYGIVTTVKDQGNYGTCWAFGTIAAVESSVLLNGGTRMEYARDLTLVSPATSFRLTRDDSTATAQGAAMLDTANAYDGTIFWSYTGDTDSIEVLTTCSESGQEMDLFRFTKPGKVTARATSGADVKLYKELTFTATVQEIGQITLDSGEYQMKVGEELQLEPVITPADVWDDTILYTSSDPTVAYVDKNGKITALKAGTAVITLEGGDQILEATVTVTGKRRSSSGSGSSGYSYTGPGKQSAGPAETAGNWKLTEAGWTFLLTDGTAAKDLWILKSGKWYYMSGSGIMKTGWLLNRGNWYYLDLTNGDMQTGLITESGHQYYLDPASGRMLTGTVQVPGMAEPMRFNEVLPPAPTYTMDPLSGFWKRNTVDALPYGARIS